MGKVVKDFKNMIPVKNDFFKALVLGRSAWKSIKGAVLAVPKNLEVIVFKRESWDEVCKLTSNNLENVSTN